MRAADRDETPEELLVDLREALDDFEQLLSDPDVRTRVRAMIPAVALAAELGKSLSPLGGGAAARDRILDYMRNHPATVIAGGELAVVSGISEYARRVRELRVEHGWPIFSGTTVRELSAFEEWEAAVDQPLDPDELRSMKPSEYVLLGDQDLDAARRWTVANEIRKRRDLSIRDRLLAYLRANVGQPVTGEELRYVARRQSWPRRTRELRTEEGWPVATRQSGRPDLPVGTYLLERDQQAEPHDRGIPDAVRVAVLERDGFSCACCGWRVDRRTPGDPRSLLELHHVDHHADGGGNEPQNLVSLCNVHHDSLHADGARGRSEFDDWLARCRG